MIELALPLLRNTGLMAVVALAYGIILSQWRHAPAAIVLGLLCGLGAILAMLDPTEVTPGVLVDSRTTLITLSGLFGGPVAAGISGVMAALFRIHLGGAGSFAGVTIIAISAMLGLVVHHFIIAANREPCARDVVWAASMAPMLSLGIFALPFEMAVDVFGKTFVPLNAVRVFGIMFLGMLILHERQRIKAEEEVHRLAFTDELSGLANRRAFLRRLDRAWSSWKESGQSFWLIIVDIDFFKTINDTFGHASGDEAIRTLAALIRAECRKEDFAARLGGEEFALLLTDTPPRDGPKMAERLRMRVAQSVAETEAGQIRFTVSVGVCEPSDSTASADALLVSADQALYRAKRNGRNAVVVDRGAGLLDTPIHPPH